jgi:hypothetical protein
MERCMTGRIWLPLLTVFVDPVSTSVELSERPDQAAANNHWATLLKYAMVEDDFAAVDPIGVLSISNGSAGP